MATLEKCYEEMGGDYKGVLGRLMKEERIVRFLGKFKNDNVWETLEKSVEAKQWEEAFRAAHSLKGMCANLGITRLENSSSELTEALRNGEPAVDVSPLLEQARTDYEIVMKALETL